MDPKKMTIKKIKIQIEIPNFFLLKGEIEKKLFLQKAKKTKKKWDQIKNNKQLGMEWWNWKQM